MGAQLASKHSETDQLLALVQDVEYLRNRYIQRTGNTIDLIDAGIDLTQLNSAELRVINVGAVGNFFDRKPFAQSNLAQPITDPLTYIFPFQ